MLLRITIFILFAMTLSTCKVFAWGKGHHDNAKFIIDCLPSEISDFLSEKDKKILEAKWCKYPDGHKPEPKVSELIGESALEEMKKNKIVRYQLHESRGQAVSFIMLTKAFQEKNSARAAFWIGALSHTIADESAFNHGPLTHFLTYAKYKHVKYPKSGLTGLSAVNQHPELMKMIKAELKGFKAKAIADSPEKALLKVMTQGVKDNAFMTSREAKLVAGMKNKNKNKEKAFQAMSEVAVHQVKETVDTIYTAWMLAKENKIPELTKDILKETRLEKEKILKNRSLSEDSIYNGLLETPKGKIRAGIVFESSIRMNEGKLGFSSKFISASAARTLKQNGISCMPVSYREFSEEGLPSPEKMPIFIICNGKKTLTKNTSSNLDAYIKNDGKVIWIGGKDLKLFGTLSKALYEEKDESIPVSRRYGLQNAETVKNAEIVFEGPIAKALGKKVFTFRDNPNTRAGWQKPWFPYGIKTENKELLPLCELKTDGRTFCIAAAAKNEKGKFQFVCLPEYLVSPFLLSDDDHMPDWSQPTLDSVSAVVLLESIKLLEQK